MKYFLDTEFLERPYSIDLISIGIVCEDGRRFYAENRDFQASRFDSEPWLKEHVLPHLHYISAGFGPDIDMDPGGGMTWAYNTPEEIGNLLRRWVGPNPEFWGYYADYDWVVLCWCFGRMIDLPEGWPMYCRDIKQMIDMKGSPKSPIQSKNCHDALSDALYHQQLYEWIYDV